MFRKHYFIYQIGNLSICMCTLPSMHLINYIYLLLAVDAVGLLLVMQNCLALHLHWTPCFPSVLNHHLLCCRLIVTGLETLPTFQPDALVFFRARVHNYYFHQCTLKLYFRVNWRLHNTILCVMHSLAYHLIKELYSLHVHGPVRTCRNIIICIG